MKGTRVFLFCILFLFCGNLFAHDEDPLTELQHLDLSTVQGMGRARVIVRQQFVANDPRRREDTLRALNTALQTTHSLPHHEWPIATDILFRCMRASDTDSHRGNPLSLRDISLRTLSYLYRLESGATESWHLDPEIFQAMRRMLDQAKRQSDPLLSNRIDTAVELLANHVLSGNTESGSARRQTAMEIARSTILSQIRQDTLTAALNSGNDDFALVALHIIKSRAQDNRPFRTPARVQTALIAALNSRTLRYEALEVAFRFLFAYERNIDADQLKRAIEIAWNNFVDYGRGPARQFLAQFLYGGSVSAPERQRRLEMWNRLNVSLPGLGDLRLLATMEDCNGGGPTLHYGP